jgi:hybrid cluster-associated redox disulfide protein
MTKKKSDNKKEFEITIDSNIMEVLEKFPRAAEIFAEYGLPCAGCVAASYERLSDIVGEFGVDGEELIRAIKGSVEK